MNWAKINRQHQVVDIIVASEEWVNALDDPDHTYRSYGDEAPAYIGGTWDTEQAKFIDPIPYGDGWIFDRDDWKWKNPNLPNDGAAEDDNAPVKE